MGYQEMKEETDRVTAMLCALCELWEASGYPLAKLPPGLHVWWDRHKEVDRKRILEEQRKLDRLKTRASAISKLTTEERNALGL